MFRLFGILAVIAGSSGLAFSIVGERKEYLERCRQWREVITLMEHEIAFQKSPLPEICSRVGMHLTGDKKVFLERVGKTFDEGDGSTLGEIWRRETGMVFAKEPLKKEVKKEVEELGKKLCFEDSEMQRKVLQDVEKSLKKHEEAQENLYRERNKLTLCAGVMGGLLLTILLL